MDLSAVETGTLQPKAPEAPKSEISVSSFAKLGINQEAVCAGNRVIMGFLEQTMAGTALSDDEKKENAEKVAQAIKNGEIKNGDNDYTAEDVLGVEKVMQQLTSEDGPYAGILFQCSGDETGTGIESAGLLTLTAYELARAA